MTQTHGPYLWTRHAQEKMRYYRLTEARVKRIVRHPVRVEEGVLEDAIACMQIAEGKRYSEIWVMYVMVKSKIKDQNAKIRIITAWRYPGKSPERDPVPAHVLREVKSLLI